MCNIIYGCNVDSLSNNNKIIREVCSFNGRKYNKIIVMYDTCHFSMIAYILLDWAVHNPEKVS